MKEGIESSKEEIAEWYQKNEILDIVGTLLLIQHKDVKTGVLKVFKKEHRLNCAQKDAPDRKNDGQDLHTDAAEVPIIPGVHNSAFNRLLVEDLLIFDNQV